MHAEELACARADGTRKDLTFIHLSMVQLREVRLGTTKIGARGNMRDL